MMSLNSLAIKLSLLFVSNKRERWRISCSIKSWKINLRVTRNGSRSKSTARVMRPEVILLSHNVRKIFIQYIDLECSGNPEDALDEIANNSIQFSPYKPIYPSDEHRQQYKKAEEAIYDFTNGKKTATSNGEAITSPNNKVYKCTTSYALTPYRMRKTAISFHPSEKVFCSL